MKLPDLNALEIFRLVAQTGNITQTAKKLGLTQPALSQRIQNLENQLGIRLFNRNTRSLILTPAGKKLFQNIAPSLHLISESLTDLQSDYKKIQGYLRIEAPPIAAELILWPKIQPLLKQYPALKIEIHVEAALSNIVAKGFDGGVRLGECLEMDMISFPLGPRQRMLAVTAPDFFKNRNVPQTPWELPTECCIGQRFFRNAPLYRWEFEQKGKEVRITPAGSLETDNNDLLLKATLAGAGIGFLPEIQAMPYLKSGQLETILEDWCPSFEGYYFYYPNRRHHSAAFTRLIETLRQNPEN